MTYEQIERLVLERVKPKIRRLPNEALKERAGEIGAVLATAGDDLRENNPVSNSAYRAEALGDGEGKI